MFAQTKRAPAKFQGARRPHVPNQKESYNPLFGERESLKNELAHRLPKGLTDSTSSAAQTSPHLLIIFTWPLGLGVQVGGTPGYLYRLISPATSPSPSHPWAFAQAVIGRFHQVLAARPWASHSPQGL